MPTAQPSPEKDPQSGNDLNSSVSPNAQTLAILARFRNGEEVSLSPAEAQTLSRSLELSSLAVRAAKAVVVNTMNTPPDDEAIHNSDGFQ